MNPKRDARIALCKCKEGKKERKPTESALKRVKMGGNIHGLLK